MANSPIAVIVDPSANPATGTPSPATNRPGSPLYTSPPQAGVLGLGSDYAATPTAQVFKTDQYGSQYVVNSTPAGMSQVVAQASSPVAPYYGMPIMARQDLPTPANWQAMTCDATGAIQVHEKSKVTLRYIVPSISGAAAGKSMFSIYNGSAATIVRIQQVNVQTPYLYATGQQVLGLGGTYNQSVLMLMELRRISGQIKGTATTTIGYALADTGDAAMVDAGIVALSNATISGAASTPYHRADTNSPSGLPWYLRGDSNSKTLNLRPTEGVSLTTITNTSNILYDIEVVVTVAAG